MGAKDDKPQPGLGGVQHDARGNAVWQWAVESGKQALESTSRLLKRLEVPGLKLEGDGDISERKGPDEAKVHTPGTRGAMPSKPGPAKSDRQTGYNPYGGAAGGRAGGAGLRPGAAMNTGPARKPAAGTARRLSFWRRLFRKN